MVKKYLSCPFCGGQPTSDWLHYSSEEKEKKYRDWLCGCIDCDMYFIEETQELAETKWNTRKPAENVAIQLEELFKHHNATKTVKRLVMDIVNEGGENG